MNWFETLTGIREESPQQVRESLSVSDNTLRSLINGQSWVCGDLEIPTLAELRQRASSKMGNYGSISVREVVADVQQLHREKANAGSVFQVASQFNLLEMVSPHVTPENGVGVYERDRTQGPACAIAAGAGTIYRNYFAVVNGRIGQSHDNQIDCLAGIGSLLDNSDEHLWRMRNGYAMPTENGLREISHTLAGCSEMERDRLRQAMRIGMQWDTQVTLYGLSHRVSQAYCSALPVAYSMHSPDLWAEFATLILEAAYEATICAAIVNSEETGNNALYLTLLGGGAFGNDADWIVRSIRRAVSIYDRANLNVAIVSYGYSNPGVRQLVDELNHR